MDQTVYWDKVAWTKEFAHPFDIDRFAAYVGRNARILDMGCGYGRTLNQLYEEGYRDIVGLDSSRELIRRGRSLYPQLNLRILEGPTIPYGQVTFAGIILFAVLTCMPEDDDQRHMLAECQRVLQPGGILYISDYPLQHDARRMERYARYQDLYGRYGIFETPDGGIFRHHDRAWIQELTTAFAPLDYTEIEVVTMNGESAIGFQWLGRKKA